MVPEGRLKLFDVARDIFTTSDAIVAKVPIYLKPTIGSAPIEDVEYLGDFGRIGLGRNRFALPILTLEMAVHDITEL